MKNALEAPRPIRKPQSEVAAALPLDRDLLIRMHDLMVQSRALEERLIQMYRQGHGFFWIGGPGEEAFNVPLGLLIKKGEGLDYDYLHFHYRQSATLLAMGEDPIGALRQMKNTATDPYSGGRNFAGHFSIKRWNEKCPAKFLPPEYGSVAVFFICRSAPIGSSPIARSVADCR